MLKVLIIIGVVILVICLISFIYVSIISKKDGQIADPIYTEISFACKTASNILVNLKQQDRTGLCRVSRGILGIRIEVSCSGDPPIHFDKEIRADGRTETEMHQLCAHAASCIEHFTSKKFAAVLEYGDSYLIEPNRYQNL